MYTNTNLSKVTAATSSDGAASEWLSEWNAAPYEPASELPAADRRLLLGREDEEGPAETETGIGVGVE